jgi:alpha-mannosidase
MTVMLRVYGVGDHGGGPTRRDLASIVDMNAWPVFPSICFGTFGQYFAEVEQVAEQLPEVRGELNPIFTGCYTSQSRIKKANHVAETALYEAEAFRAWAALARGGKYPAEALARAWQNTLFSQFHDIIPGSGTADTREYALGLFQQTMATAGSQKARATGHRPADRHRILGAQRAQAGDLDARQHRHRRRRRRWLRHR